ncbi:MAG: SDR family oxidoreductase [Proteobacteria bacterium]|jgi:dihydroflavonol-4-reductase|nr:SDR family oxidoreductase [Pseudomonadota bacterium]
MVIAVTGASGHIGANLVPTLVEAGEQVRVMVRQDRRSVEGLDVECIEGDVLDKSVVAKLVDGAEVVYNLAAHITLWRKDKRAEVNIQGPRNVAEACLNAGVRRLVHASSIHALKDHPLDEPIDEERAPADETVNRAYDKSKAAGEREVRQAIEKGLDAVIVNPTGVIGPKDLKLSRMGQVIYELATGKMLALIDAGYDFVDVRDVVFGMMAAMEKGRTGERYLLSGNHVTLAGFAKIIEAESGVAAPRWTSPMWLAQVGAPFSTAWAVILGQEPKFTSASLEVLRGNQNILHDKATAELGYNPRPTADTVVDTIAWMRQTGLLPPKVQR